MPHSLPQNDFFPPTCYQEMYTSCPINAIFVSAPDHCPAAHHISQHWNAGQPSSRLFLKMCVCVYKIRYMMPTYSCVNMCGLGNIPLWPCTCYSNRWKTNTPCWWAPAYTPKYGCIMKFAEIVLSPCFLFYSADPLPRAYYATHHSPAAGNPPMVRGRHSTGETTDTQPHRGGNRQRGE